MDLFRNLLDEILFLVEKNLYQSDLSLPPDKYICGYGISRKGFSGPRRSFRPHRRPIYIVYEFLGHTSAFPFTLGKHRTAD